MVDHNGRCFSIYAYLLPHLNQGPPYDATNFNLNPDNAPPAALAGGAMLQPEKTTTLHQPRLPPVSQRLLRPARRKNTIATSV
jgi:hypothetical protein